MKTTWKKSDRSHRRKLAFGFLLVVLGIGITSYCGYMARYLGDPQPDGLKLFGWGSLLIGLVLYVLGLLQSPIHR